MFGLDPNSRKLAAFLAADELLGARCWTWDKLAEWGFTLNMAEAEQRVEQGYLKNSVRSELYDTLFQFHPELLATLNPKHDENHPHHFMIQFSKRPGFPEPNKELESLDNIAASYERRLVWCACTRDLTNWRPAKKGRSRAILFYSKGQSGIVSYCGEVLGRNPRKPSAKYLDNLYADKTNIKSWVLLGGFTRMEIDRLDDIPGISWQGKPATISFRGQNAFSYWTFNDDDLRLMPLKRR